MKPANEIVRCSWCFSTPTYIEYHDTEWGVPNHDDQKHFEFLVLESAQAGLSWLTILNKREGYQRLFAGFDPQKVATFTSSDIDRLTVDSSIIRNRQKIKAAVNNARLFLQIKNEYESFDNYIWNNVDNKPIFRQSDEAFRATSPESDALSKDLKKRGFKFLGSTIMHAHMQAMGLINDHSTG